jgi:hypothetical protein
MMFSLEYDSYPLILFFHFYSSSQYGVLKDGHDLPETQLKVISYSKPSCMFISNSGQSVSDNSSGPFPKLK